MLLLIFAVVLTVAQTAPLLSPKTTDNQILQTAEDQRKANNNHTNSAVPVSAAQLPPTTQSTGTTDTKGHKDAEETIRVSELPSVTVKAGPDWWTRIYVLLTGALVAIGFFGVRYARRTLRAIESQLGTMQGQLQQATVAAQAAEKSAQALMDGERAWLLVGNVGVANDDPIDNALRHSGDGPVTLASPWLSIQGATFVIKNYGKTPGTITAINARVEIGDSRDTPPNPQDVYEAEPVLTVIPVISGNKTNIEEHVVPQDGDRLELARPVFSFSLTEQKLTRIKNDADFLWTYGTVQYRDVYGRTHETRFCYRYIVPPEEPMNHFCLRGPEQYNKAT